MRGCVPREILWRRGAETSRLRRCFFGKELPIQMKEHAQEAPRFSPHFDQRRGVEQKYQPASLRNYLNTDNFKN